MSFATAVFIVLFRGDIDAGIAGLCLAYALQATSSLNALIRNSADFEVNIVSVERIAEYIELQSEVSGAIESERFCWTTHLVLFIKRTIFN